MNDQPQPPSRTEPPSPSPAELRLYELLEVLRPDAETHEKNEDAHQDAAREELAELLEKHPHLLEPVVELWPEIARVDDLISDAVGDVAVPEGFQLRLLDSIQAHKATFEKTRQTYKRRAWQLSLAATVVAVSLAVLVPALRYFLQDHSGTWQKDRVLNVASKLFGEAPPAATKDLSASLSEEERVFLDNFRPSDDVLRPKDATWATVEFIDRRAVVYRFEDSHGNRAALFVLQQPRALAGLINRPPRRPQSMTAGHTAGVWQSDGLVYVLVSSGDETAWRSLLVPERPVT